MEDLAPPHEEFKKYLESNYIKKVIDEVQNRLGYESQLSFGKVK